MNHAVPLVLRAKVGAVIALALAGVPSARAQDLWELEPYSIGLVVVADRSPELEGALATDVATGAQARLASLGGAAWTLTRLDADPELAARLTVAARAAFPDETLPEALPREWRRLDKLFVVSLTTSGGGIDLAVRDFDLRVQSWSASQERFVAARRELAEASAQALLAAFAPLARIDVEEKQVVLRFKASRLPLRDPGLRFVEAGDLFQPFVRTADRDGATRRAQAILWTFLRAANPVTDGWTAEVISGLRNPLSSKRRGRAEQLALRIRVPAGPTVLRLRSRTDAERPLIGYEVFAVGQKPDETTLLGLSNEDGDLVIPPGDAALRSLVIKHGGLLLARLPIVPGWRPEVTVPLPDDDIRLEYEGQLVGLQEEIVDHVARRGALILQTRARLDDGKTDEAKKIYQRLSSLPNRAQFASKLTLLRNQIAAANIKDPQTQARIAQMLVDTEKVLSTFLMENELRELDQELRGK